MGEPAEHEVKPDGLVGVDMDERGELCGVGDGGRELLAEFSGDAGGEGFAGGAFAAGEFPFAGEGASGAPRREQQLVSKKAMAAQTSMQVSAE